MKSIMYVYEMLSAGTTGDSRSVSILTCCNTRKQWCIACGSAEANSNKLKGLLRESLRAHGLHTVARCDVSEEAIESIEKQYLSLQKLDWIRYQVITE